MGAENTRGGERRARRAGGDERRQLGAFDPPVEIVGPRRDSGAVAGRFGRNDQAAGGRHGGRGSGCVVLIAERCFVFYLAEQ